MMDTLEKFYIFLETTLNKQINDKLKVKPNIIFENIVQKTTIVGYPSPLINSLQCSAQSSENLRQCPLDKDFRIGT
jgi:hypothetical protein